MQDTINDSMTLEQFTDLKQSLLVNHYIPCTLEYPGYIWIPYRSWTIIIGEECGEMRITVENYGEYIDDASFAFDCRMMAIENMIAIIKQYLLVCYLKIDIFLKRSEL